MTRCAVLGCGPAGLIAAHTLVQNGYDDVTIFSLNEVKSAITGAQFLHAPIFTTGGVPDFSIRFEKVGRERGYANKVYGDPTARCSWKDYPSGSIPAWSLRDTYDRLWDLYRKMIHTVYIDAAEAQRIEAAHDLTINTIPAHNLCVEGHEFPKQEIWIKPQAPSYLQEGHVVYNGDPMNAWYRASKIQGEGSTEYGHPVVGAWKGFKPLDTVCDCQPQIARAGRFGLWKKGVLLHQVPDQVRELLP